MSPACRLEKHGHTRDSEARPCELTVQGDTYFSVRLDCQLWLDRLDT